MKKVDRLLAVKKLISQNAIHAMIVSSVPNIVYLTGYAGFSDTEREAYLLITKNSQYIFTDGRYSTAIEKEVPDFTLQEISGTAPFTSLLETIIKDEQLSVIGFESGDLRVAEYVKIRKVCPKVKDISLRNVRIKKTPDEIEQIKKACDISSDAYAHVLTKLQIGISEKELAWEFEKYVGETGAALSFPTIIAFGENAAVPHHHTSDSNLTKNMFVLIDCGVKYQNYCSDMTRTVFFGTATPEQKKMYQTVLDAQEKAIDFITQFCHSEVKPKNPEILHSAQDDIHIPAAHADKIAREFILSAGYPTIPHSLGHGIGIEVHEAPTLSPSSKDILEEGMVFSIEPGIYLPHFGGVRIEDLFTIQDGKLKQLTESPKGIGQFIYQLSF